MKFWLAVFFLIFSNLPSYAVEEVILKTDEEAASKTSYLFEEVLTKHFDKSPVESIHLFGYYRAGGVVDIENDDTDTEYDFYSINAGVNYFIKGQALKLILNYVFCQNDLLKDSHRIILGTQILL